MIQIGKLMKLAKGNFSEDEFMELMAGFGMEGAAEKVPAERKADAFQQVAQLSVQPDAEALLLRFTHKSGAQIQGLLVYRPGQPGVMREAEKTLDRTNVITLPSCQLP